MKGYKIINSAQDKKIGIVGSTLREIIIKGCKKLEIDDEQVTVILLDGTIVEDEEYFQTLPAQTLFIFRINGEPFQTGVDIVYNALLAVNNDILKTSMKVKSFMSENMKEKIRTLSSILDLDQNQQTDLTLCSLKSKHPEWFHALDTRAKTKEEFMFKRCQERIRGYMYKTKADMTKTDLYVKNSKCRQHLDEVYKGFTELLNKNKYHGFYFDRSESNCLCNEVGTFTCQGAWNLTNCSYERGMGHKINPYQSRESRIIFSTWNLDHWVERSRSVIPALFEASLMASKECRSINIHYFYELLFTTVNLKLVHIVCHDKGQHDSAKCDPQFYLKNK